jgi:hypothetical protein
MDSASQYALAYALTTSAGIRGLLTLAVASLAAHFGWIHPPAGFAWIGSDSATVVLLAGAFVEFLGDKVPVLDHALHAVQVVAKPGAAAILVGGVMHVNNPAELYGLMALGAVNALGVHAVTSTTRGASTALTAGLGNPILSLIEDVVAVLMLLLAFLAPFLAAGLAILATVLIWRLAHGVWRRRQEKALAQGPQ